MVFYVPDLVVGINILLYVVVVVVPYRVTVGAFCMEESKVPHDIALCVPESWVALVLRMICCVALSLIYLRSCGVLGASQRQQLFPLPPGKLTAIYRLSVNGNR